MNTENHKTFFTHPSKRILAVFSTGWGVSVACLLLAITDLFTEPFFQKRYILSYFLMLISTVVVTNIWINYLKNKNEKPPTR